MRGSNFVHLGVVADLAPGRQRDARAYPPGVPGRDFKPVFVPNGSTLPYHLGEGGMFAETAGLHLEIIRAIAGRRYS